MLKRIYCQNGETQVRMKRLVSGNMKEETVITQQYSSWSSLSVLMGSSPKVSKALRWRQFCGSNQSLPCSSASQRGGFQPCWLLTGTHCSCYSDCHPWYMYFGVIPTNTLFIWISQIMRRKVYYVSYRILITL